MSYKIVWSEEAKLTVQQNMDYLAREWDNKVLNEFLSRWKADWAKSNSIRFLIRPTSQTGRCGFTK